jgi:hypothetical protein
MVGAVGARVAYVWHSSMRDCDIRAVFSNGRSAAPGVSREKYGFCKINSNKYKNNI